MGSIGSPGVEPPGSVPLGFQHLLLWLLASGHCGEQNRFQPLPVNKHGGSREPCRGSSWQIWHLPATLSSDGGHKGCSCPPLQIPDAAQDDNRNKRHNPHTWPCRIRGQATPSTAACLTESAPEGSALQEPLGIPLSMSPDPSTSVGKERAGRLTHNCRPQQKVQEYKEEQSTPRFLTSLGLKGGRTPTLW